MVYDVIVISENVKNKGLKNELDKANERIRVG